MLTRLRLWLARRIVPSSHTVTERIAIGDFIAWKADRAKERMDASLNKHLWAKMKPEPYADPIIDKVVSNLRRMAWDEVPSGVVLFKSCRFNVDVPLEDPNHAD